MVSSLFPVEFSASLMTTRRQVKGPVDWTGSMNVDFPLIGFISPSLCVTSGTH